MADFSPTIGHEQGGRRPAVIVSTDSFNRIPIELAVVVPCTTTDRGVRLHVRIDPPDGGLRKRSFAMTEQVRCLSTRRFRARLGRLGDARMNEVEAALREVLDLDE
jgi:mRNA interferase MazF